VKQAAASRVLRSSIPDNDDCLRCFHGWTDFPRRADVKQTAASRSLRPSIPDNGDCPRRFRGLDGFHALCGRETGCRFAGFHVQAFRTTTIICGAFAGWTDFSRRADVKQAAASRGLRPSIPDNGDWPRRFRGMGEFPALCGHETDCRFAGFTFKHSGQRRLSAVLSRDGRISRVART